MKYFASKVSENLHKTPEGYLLAIGVPIGRIGEMEYGPGETPISVGNDGIVRISREEKELFKPETIASFEGKPFTIGHPAQFVDPENWKELAKGIVQNVRRGTGEFKDDLLADILITDAIAISLVENGKRQLSCGYEAEYVHTGPGIGIQKNIIGNHLALVEEGRAGDAYKINDHKGESSMNKKLEAALKKIFGKTSDEIMKEAEDKEAAEKAAENKDTKNPGYDELVAAFKDLLGKFEKIGQPADEKAEKLPMKKEGEDQDMISILQEKIEMLEKTVEKLVKHEEEEMEMEGEEEIEDEENEEEVIVDEDKEDGPKLTGDEKSKFEILAPGLNPTKEFKKDALKTVYKTEDGKKYIDSLTNGAPVFDKAEQVEILFNAVPELLKSTRNKQFSKTKTVDFNSTIFSNDDGAMTAEKMNEMNAKFYNKK